MRLHKKFSKVMLVFTMVILIITACSNEKSKSILDYSNQEIKILYYNEIAFMQEYGNYLMSKYPKLRIKVISSQGILADDKSEYFQKLFKLVQEEKPDIIVTSLYNFSEWVDSDLLRVLDSNIVESKFDIENITNIVIDAMRDRGGGKIYGMPPTFSTQGIYYNKTLFKKYNISEPSQNMGWEQVFKLATEFTLKDNNVYGFYGIYRYPYDMFIQIGMSEGLIPFNTETNQLTINTPAWKSVLEQVINIYSSGAVYSENTFEDSYLHDEFILGNAALTFQSSGYWLNLDGINFEWGIVRQPVGKSIASQTPFFSANDIFAIHKDSSNIDVAWEIIKQIMSKEFARLLLQGKTSDLVSRVDIKREVKGQSLDSFYQLKPFSQEISYEHEHIYELEKIINTNIERVLNGELNINECLETIQLEGEAVFYSS